jgi:L-iditol 2-dehydrogenase
MRVDEVIGGDKDLAERVRILTGGRGVDVVIVSAPSADAQAAAPEFAAKGGRVSLFASLPKDAPEITINSRTVHYRQVAIHGATDSTPAQVQLAVDLMASGQIRCGDIITHTFPLEKIHDGLNVMLEKQGLKVLMIP